MEHYDKACEEYEKGLFSGFLLRIGDKEPSEFFINEIEKLLNVAKTSA